MTTEQRLEHIEAKLDQLLAAFSVPVPEKPMAAVIPMARQVEIRRKADADMANKLMRRAR